MNQDGVIYNNKKIRSILLDAAKDRVLLEIRVGPDKKLFGARFIHVPGGTVVDDEAEDILSLYASQIGGGETVTTAPKGNVRDEAEDYIVISPLEPTEGNMRIRKTPEILLSFHVGITLYATKVTFQGLINVDNKGQGLKFTVPRVMRAIPRRRQARVDIPERITIPVSVQKRGSAVVSGLLMDISSGGLSFASPQAKVPLLKNDKVSVTIMGEWGPVSTFGTICFHAVSRDPRDVQSTVDQYGVQFQMLSVADAMTVDRMVKQLDLASRRS
ncbi:MAG: PilZ domain-containing protein [Magnetococcales bacterium]|nr:PilZ domain-containing protein [Magnetococcales bacterium]